MWNRNVIILPSQGLSFESIVNTHFLTHLSCFDIAQSVEAGLKPK